MDAILYNVQKNRETWLIRAWREHLAPFFEKVNIKLPSNVRLSCSWPSTRATSAASRRVGECLAGKSADGATEIMVSPYLENPMDILATLCHEAIHAAHPTAKHGGAFRDAMAVVGLIGKPTATQAGPALETVLRTWADALGDYPHAKLDLTSNKRSKAGAQYVSLKCPNCEIHARLAKSNTEKGIPVLCANGHAPIKFIFTTEKEKPVKTPDLKAVANLES